LGTASVVRALCGRNFLAITADTDVKPLNKRLYTRLTSERRNNKKPKTPSPSVRVRSPLVAGKKAAPAKTNRMTAAAMEDFFAAMSPATSDAASPTSWPSSSPASSNAASPASWPSSSPASDAPDMPSPSMWSPGWIMLGAPTPAPAPQSTMPLGPAGAGYEEDEEDWALTHHPGDDDDGNGDLFPSFPGGFGPFSGC
jgi:hypothetical protein